MSALINTNVNLIISIEGIITVGIILLRWYSNVLSANRMRGQIRQYQYNVANLRHSTSSPSIGSQPKNTLSGLYIRQLQRSLKEYFKYHSLTSSIDMHFIDYYLDAQLSFPKAPLDTYQIKTDLSRANEAKQQIHEIYSDENGPSVISLLFVVVITLLIIGLETTHLFSAGPSSVVFSYSLFMLLLLYMSFNP